MVGILIISHGAFGEALIQAAGHMLGKPLQGVVQLKVTARDDPDAVLAQAPALIGRLDEGGRADHGGHVRRHPGNITARLLAAGKVEGISGANLPMLVRALTYRTSPLAVVVDKAMSGGREGVVHMNTDCCRGPG